MWLSRRSEPFDSEHHIFPTVKGRWLSALAHIDNGEGHLVSRNGNVFHGFAALAHWVAQLCAVKAP
jgi:hypothetical protein